ncbi:unnamed protein product [Coccothraustes coccothraustes]
MRSLALPVPPPPLLPAVVAVTPGDTGRAGGAAVTDRGPRTEIKDQKFALHKVLACFGVIDECQSSATEENIKHLGADPEEEGTKSIDEIKAEASEVNMRSVPVRFAGSVHYVSQDGKWLRGNDTGNGESREQRQCQEAGTRGRNEDLGEFLDLWNGISLAGAQAAGSPGRVAARAPGPAVHPAATRWRLGFGNAAAARRSSLPRESGRAQGKPAPPFHCPGSGLKISDRSFCKVFPRTTMISL